MNIAVFLMLPFPAWRDSGPGAAPRITASGPLSKDHNKGSIGATMTPAFRNILATLTVGASAALLSPAARASDLAALVDSNGSNGGNPHAGLTGVGGTLYGITEGSTNDGTLFSYTPGASSVDTLVTFSTGCGFSGSKELRRPTAMES